MEQNWQTLNDAELLTVFKAICTEMDDRRKRVNLIRAYSYRLRGQKGKERIPEFYRLFEDDGNIREVCLPAKPIGKGKVFVHDIELPNGAVIKEIGGSGIVHYRMAFEGDFEWIIEEEDAHRIIRGDVTALLEETITSYVDCHEYLNENMKKLAAEAFEWPGHETHLNRTIAFERESLEYYRKLILWCGGSVPIPSEDKCSSVTNA